MQTDVLIVGAGPTGLMAANQLMRFGINFIIIDKKSGPTIESRAIAVTARSMEVYQQMGLADKAIEGGHYMTSFNVFSRGKIRASIHIGEIGKGISEFSYMLAFEQSKNETLLANNLNSHGKKVYWKHEFVALTEHQDRINARVKQGDKEKDVSAKYLIACDGANSPIRYQLGFSFKGGTYHHKFFVADTEVEWGLGYDKLIIAPGKVRFCAFFPLGGDNTLRVIGTLPDHLSERDDIEFSDIKESVKDIVKRPITFKKVNWFSIYKLHHRRVSEFRKGNVFLAGDSAHIHSPAGGQGMNTGLQDAYNLCWKLAFVLKGNADATLLDTYNEERLPFAKWLLNFTDRGFNIMTSSGRLTRLFRRFIALPLMSLALSFKWVRLKAFRVVSQTGWDYQGSSLSGSCSRQSLKFKPGDRFPYFESDNQYPKLKAACFHLVHVNKEPLNNLSETINEKFPFEVKVIEDQNTDKWAALGVKKELFILVRPDNYISVVCDNLEQIGDNKVVKKYFD